jgi:hypothetical protein
MLSVSPETGAYFGNWCSTLERHTPEGPKPNPSLTSRRMIAGHNLAGKISQLRWPPHMQPDFVDSEKGQFLAYRKRQKRIFRFWWSGKLQSKRSARPEINTQFQNDLLAAMKLFGHRGPFTGPLMVDIRFSASTRNAPEVHTLAKHYLDLLHRPVAGALAGRSKILFRDDSQIDFLSCEYDNPAEEDCIYLRVRPLRDFAEDLDLYHDIKDGSMESEVDLDDLRDADFNDDTALENYAEFRADKRAFIERFGQRVYDSLDLLNKRQAQETILSRRQIDLASIAFLLRTRFHHMRRRPEMTSILNATAEMVRNLFEQPFMSVDFGTRPLQKGESGEFRERVRQALVRAVTRNPLLHPLLVPCGVTVLYLPPVDAPKIDLDNLMRESIMPSVHEILQPPATPLNFLLATQPPEIDKHLLRMIEEYKRAPKFHVTGYQVICLPRLPSDRPKGNVRLVLHKGDVWSTTWEKLESVLKEWERTVERKGII